MKLNADDTDTQFDIHLLISRVSCSIYKKNSYVKHQYY